MFLQFFENSCEHREMCNITKGSSFASLGAKWLILGSGVTSPGEPLKHEHGINKTDLLTLNLTFGLAFLSFGRNRHHSCNTHQASRIHQNETFIYGIHDHEDLNSSPKLTKDRK